MLNYLVRRVLQGLVVLFLVSIVTFVIMHLAPGDPVNVLVGFENEPSPELVAHIRETWGLDRPWYRQYVTWMGNIVRGDFGTSIYRPGVPIQEMILEAAWPTFQLNALAILLSLSIAVPAGLLAAIKRNSIFDSATMIISSGGIALPSFWVGLMLIVLFASELRWLPANGLGSWKHYLMPVAVLALNDVAILVRLMRASTLETIGQEFVQTARAKGLSSYAVISRHVIRNAFLPVFTVLGVRVAFLLSGTVIVETIFGIGGLGRLFYQSVTRLDYQVVQAIVILFAALVVFVNIITDLTYAYIDPRIRTK